MKYEPPTFLRLPPTLSQRKRRNIKMGIAALALALVGGLTSLATLAKADPEDTSSSSSSTTGTTDTTGTSTTQADEDIDNPDFTIPTIPLNPESLTECLSPASIPIFLPSSPDFELQTQPYNLRIPYTPSVLVMPTTIPEIQTSILCAASFNIPVQARSGGHSYASHSTGGEDGALIIDLQAFQDIILDPKTLTATIGGGVRLGNLALALHAQGEALLGEGGGRAVSHGTCPSVGVGGHFTHGGYGFSSRAWGLGMDAIISMDVVLPNGTYTHLSSTQNSEPFFGFRGAAENYGIVVSFEMETQEAPQSVVHFTYDLGDVLGEDDGVGKVVEVMHGVQDIALDGGVTGRNMGFEIYVAWYGISVTGTYFGSLEEFEGVVAPAFMEVTGVEGQVDVHGWISSLETLGWVDSLAVPVAGLGKGGEHSNFYAKSLTTPESDPLTEEAITAYFEYILAEGRRQAPVQWWGLITLWGGADSQISSHDGEEWGAYGQRDALWVFQHYGYVDNDELFPQERGMAFVEGLNGVIPEVMEGVDFGGYKNYDDPVLSRTEAHEMYYGVELAARLKNLKGEVDPGNVFAHPQSFEP